MDMRLDFSAGYASAAAAAFSVPLEEEGSLSATQVVSAKVLNRGNTTPAEIMPLLNDKLVSTITRLTLEEIESFVSRGGTLNIISEEKVNESCIAIRRGEQVITGCNAGINRSQVTAAILLNHHINCIGVLSGGESAMNPAADSPGFADLDFAEEPYGAFTNFQKYFRREKQKQIGLDELTKQNLHDYPKNETQVKAAKAFYENFINNLAPTHFITFGPCGYSVVCLLNKRPQASLEGFTVSHCPWGDEVNTPHASLGMKKFSEETYKLFADKIRNAFYFSFQEEFDDSLKRFNVVIGRAERRLATYTTLKNSYNPATLISEIDEQLAALEKQENKVEQLIGHNRAESLATPDETQKALCGQNALKLEEMSQNVSAKKTSFIELRAAVNKMN